MGEISLSGFSKQIQNPLRLNLQVGFLLSGIRKGYFFDETFSAQILEGHLSGGSAAPFLDAAIGTDCLFRERSQRHVRLLDYRGHVGQRIIRQRRSGW